MPEKNKQPNKIPVVYVDADDANADWIREAGKGDPIRIQHDKEKAQKRIHKLLQLSLDKAIMDLEQKSRIYLKPGQQPPKGIPVQRGKHGGMFYDTERAVGFYTPNQAENMSLEQAMQQVSSPAQQQFKALGQQLDQQVGIRGRFEDTLGDTKEWGTENSIMTVKTRMPSAEAFKYVMAKLGAQGNQKAVVSFVANAQGKDSVHLIDIPPVDLNQMRAELDKVGLDYRSITTKSNGRGYRISIYDEGTKLSSNIEQFRRTYHGKARAVKGQGEFIGADTREAAQGVYQEVIGGYERRGVLGQDIRGARGVEGHNLNLGNSGNRPDRADNSARVSQERSEAGQRQEGANLSQQKQVLLKDISSMLRKGEDNANLKGDIGYAGHLRRENGGDNAFRNLGGIHKQADRLQKQRMGTQEERYPQGGMAGITEAGDKREPAITERKGYSLDNEAKDNRGKAAAKKVILENIRDILKADTKANIEETAAKHSCNTANERISTATDNNTASDNRGKQPEKLELKQPAKQPPADRVIEQPLRQPLGQPPGQPAERQAAMPEGKASVTSERNSANAKLEGSTGLATPEPTIQTFLKGYRQLAMLGSSLSERKLDWLTTLAYTIRIQKGLKTQWRENDSLDKVMSIDAIAHELHTISKQHSPRLYPILDDIASMSHAAGETNDREDRLIYLSRDNALEALNKLTRVDIIKSSSFDNGDSYWKLYSYAIKYGAEKLTDEQCVTLREWIYSRI